MLSRSDSTGSSASPPPLPGELSERRAAGLAFAVAFATLFAQVLVHRVASAKLLNNYAFLVISLTMLGFAVSGVVLTRLLPTFLGRVRDWTSSCAGLFSLSLILATSAFYRMEAVFRPAQVVPTSALFLLELQAWLPWALLFALPFMFCGLILGALLSAPQWRVGRIYFSDLLGSAAGAFLVIPAISHFGVEVSLLAVSAGLPLVALALTPPRSSWGRALLAAGVVTTVVAAAEHERVFEMYYPDGSMLAASRDPESGFVVDHVAWDPLSRIEFSRFRFPDVAETPFPALFGRNDALLARYRRLLTQNNFAFTVAVEYDGDPGSLEGIDDTIYAAAYQASLVQHPEVGAIGVGGGYDVLTAIRFGAKRVTGVEVNGATVDVLTDSYRDYFRHWVDDPRVELVQAEGRHFLATTDRRFDVLQLTGVDSYNGTTGAAHVFSESYLYTAEAFDLYLDRLNERGILNLIRLEFPVPREMLRALASAVAALRRAGVAEPAKHIVTLSQPKGNLTALLVQKTPFEPEQVQRLVEWCQDLPYLEVSAAHGVVLPQPSTYQFFLSQVAEGTEAEMISVYPFDIRPATDDRPFFFRYSFWWHLVSDEPLLRGSLPAMEITIVVLFGLVVLVAVLAIYGPLRYLTARSPLTVGTRRYALYFSGAGLGFLAVEMALLQKFGLFLGHPNYALSVVLAGLLLTSGVGSLLSARTQRVLGGIRPVAYALAGNVLVEVLLVFGRLAGWIGWPFAVRVAVTIILIAPIGLLLGTFLPVGLEQLKGEAASFTPWAWGINGAFSVLAPVLAVAFSMSWGTSALLLAALPIYMFTAAVLPASAHPPDTGTSTT